MTQARRLGLLAVLVVSISSVARADTISLLATGQGWCTDSSCNNTNPDRLANTFAGSHPFVGMRPEFRDWFAFKVPMGAEVSSAALSVWNDEHNFSELADAMFEVRNASGISFAGLAGTTTWGSVSVSAADAGMSRFVPIRLNSDALSVLNAARGHRLLFGGVVTPFDSGHEVQIFGYTGGHPAALLDLVREPAPVPEPSTLLLVGMGAMALVRKRLRRAALGL